MKIYNLVSLFLLSLLFACNQPAEIAEDAPLTDELHTSKTAVTSSASIVFRSADGGQTWQDISNGLTEPVLDDYVGGRNVFYADDNGLYLTDRNWIYHSNTNARAPYWTKASMPNETASIVPGKNGIYAYHYQTGILQKAKGTDAWLPVFPDFTDKRVRSMLETAEGTLFVSTDKGLFKSANSGKSWKLLPTGGLGGKTVQMVYSSPPAHRESCGQPMVVKIGFG